jgi:hypothetical protein
MTLIFFVYLFIYLFIFTYFIVGNPWCNIDGDIICHKLCCYACHSRAPVSDYTVKSVFSGHPGDHKFVAEQDRWSFRTDCFNRECAAEGQRQSGRLTWSLVPQNDQIS